jgi:hypothetical protein
MDSYFNDVASLIFQEKNVILNPGPILACHPDSSTELALVSDKHFLLSLL